MRKKPKNFAVWLKKVKKEGVRKRFLRWMISIILPHHHIAKSGPGRKKKVKVTNEMP